MAFATFLEEKKFYLEFLAGKLEGALAAAVGVGQLDVGLELCTEIPKGSQAEGAKIQNQVSGLETVH